MKTVIRHGRHTVKAYGLKAVEGAPPGTFEAIVAVFGNVDVQGDRIIPGAFAASLAEWKASGDPIPVVFSHQWGNMDAHVGEVIDAKELLPGDPALAGTGLEENGGLWTKFSLFVDDPDEAPTRRLAKRLDRRTIREFSFAYDVIDESRGTDGANELKVLDLIEVGPTLKGANPATVLLGKALGDGWEDLGEDEIFARLAKAVAEAKTGEKASVSVTFAGSAEETLNEIRAAAVAWAEDLDAGNGGFYYLHSEATYPAELRAIVLIEGWDDPIGEGIFYELTMERAEDGTLSVKDAAEIEITVDVAKKSRDRIRKAWSAISAKTRATVTGDDHHGKGDGNGDDPEDPTSRTTEDGDEGPAWSARDEADLALMAEGLEPTDPEE